jgi:NAD-dependent dihydropyrimidine dehydrogenase PreA subunit
MARPVWFVKLIQRFFPRRFALARLTRLSFLGKVVDHGLFDGDNIIYLPKDGSVKSIQIHESIRTQGDIVLPSQVVEYFIDKSNYHWIMNFCICRDSDGCQDYPVELGCLFLGEAVLNIRSEYGRLVSKDEALEHVRRCQEAGLVHLIGRNKLDTIWLGVGPGEKLMTICNCCPCCCLWKMLPQLTPMISNRVTRMDGVSVTITDLCGGCGTCCEGICFVDAIHLVNGRAIIDDECRGCGRCVEVCPNEAIELKIASSAFVQEAIERLAPLVDLS